MTYYISAWASRTIQRPTYDPITHLPTGTVDQVIHEAVAGAQATTDGREWQLCCDFRADIAATGGYALVWTAGNLSTLPTGVWLLAATLDTALSATVRNRVASFLGVPTLPNGTTLRDAIRRLMTTDATGPSTGRWKNLPNFDGTFSIVLGDTVDEWPAT